MKKILLASTILVGTAGFAAADTANFTFSGAAYVGVSYSTGFNEANSSYDANGDSDSTDVFGAQFAFEVTSSFTVGMKTMTDMGLEAGASIEVSAPGVSTEDDHTDRAFGISSTSGSSVSDASAYLSGDFGKLMVAYDADGDGLDTAGVDGFWGTADDVDAGYDITLTYTGTWGDFDLEAYYVWNPVGAGTNGDMGAKGTYNFGDYSVWAQIFWDASNTDWGVSGGGSASMSGFTASAQIDYTNWNGDIDWKLTAGYETGAFTVGAFAEDDGTDDQIDFGVNGSYDLGGGVSLDAAYIYDNDQNNGLLKAGATMSF